MTVRVAVNGFGRIGRNFLRALHASAADIEVVALNDLVSPQANAHLLRYDSTHGRFGGTVVVDDRGISVDGKAIAVLAERDPTALPWKELGVDVVVESTGRFTKREAAAAHVEAGAKRVVISAPSEGADATFVVGVNDDTFDPATHVVVSNASCTTNCFVPMVKVLDDAFGIRKGLMTTVHAYTNDQELLDFARDNLRRARAGAINIVPIDHGRGPRHRARPRRDEGAARRHVAPRAGRRTARSPTSPRSSAPRSTSAGVNAGLRRRGVVGAALGGPRLHRGPDRLERHRRLAGVVHLRLRADDGDAARRRHHARQGLRLVRQRVGLLEPARRPGRDRRSRREHRCPGARGPAPARRQAGPRPGRLQRPARRRPGRHAGRHGRLPHPRQRSRRCSGCSTTAPSVTVCTHLGRPKGEPDPRYDRRPGARPPGRTRARRRAAREPPLRPGRGGEHPAFVDRLVAGQDAYVNDAFGAAHRAHASIVGPPKRLPSAAGRLLAREVEVLGGLLDRPRAPLRRRGRRCQGR